MLFDFLGALFEGISEIASSNNTSSVSDSKPYGYFQCPSTDSTPSYSSSSNPSSLTQSEDMLASMRQQQQAQMDAQHRAGGAAQCWGRDH